MVNRPTKGCFGREDLYFAVGVPKTAFNARDEQHDAGELGQLPPDLAKTTAETVSRGKSALDTFRRITKSPAPNSRTLLP